MAEKNNIRRLNTAAARRGQKPGQAAGAGQEKKEAPVRKHVRLYYDFSLLFAVILVTGIGLLMVYSSSQYTALISHESSDYFFRKQLFFAAGGLAFAAALSIVNYRLFRPLVIPGYALAIALLILTMFIGRSSNGSTRWLRIGGIMFQPSEIVKSAVIVFTAFYISLKGYSINKPKELGKLLALVGVPVVLVARENLSSGLIIAGIVFVMVFTAMRKWFVFIGIGLAGLGAVIAAKPLAAKLILSRNLGRPESYQLRRVFGWALPDMFPDDAYQTLQGLYALGSGGLTGKGLGGSIQKFSKLPEAQNDMIFAIICEELGLIGAIAIVILFVFIIYRIMQIAANTEDLFGAFLCVGVLAHIAIQVILNIAVVTSVIPNTGVTLPFISYGGTALLCTIAEIGLVLSVAHTIRL